MGLSRADLLLAAATTLGWPPGEERMEAADIIMVFTFAGVCSLQRDSDMCHGPRVPILGNRCV